MFFEPHIPSALRRAQQYAGEHGFVASMPQLLHARTNASYDNIIWNTWFTANSEENVVTTPRGKHVVVAVHGGGILASPARMERSLHSDLSRDNPEGLTGQSAIKISQQGARDVRQGKLPDGSEIPVYPFAEFKRGVANLPRRYGVVLDFELARQAKRDVISENWPAVGAAMNTAHGYIASVGGSGQVVDALIEQALKLGARGAKLAGAGLGGTIIALHDDPTWLAKRIVECGAASAFEIQRAAPGVRSESAGVAIPNCGHVVPVTT